MDCNWCICGCGQQVYDASELYFSPECKNADARSVKNPVTQTNTPPDSPTTQLNLRFSVAIANSTAFHERGGNRGSKQSSFMSPPSSVSSSYSDSNSSITSISTIDHQYHHHHHHRHQRNDSLASVNDEEYCSKSVPINIPTSYSHADDTVMEINKGTFGKDNYI